MCAGEHNISINEVVIKLKEHLAAPNSHAALQRSQLGIRESARMLRLELLKQGLGCAFRCSQEPAVQFGVNFGKGIDARPPGVWGERLFDAMIFAFAHFTCVLARNKQRIARLVGGKSFPGSHALV